MTRTLVIAEAGVNHSGSLDTALALVDAAADAGADIVKFQTFNAKSLAGKSARKADYQQRTTDAAESQQAMLKRLELPHEAHPLLIARAKERGIEFLSTERVRTTERGALTTSALGGVMFELVHTTPDMQA